MQSLPAAIQAQIAADKSRPVRICLIYLDAGILRFAAAPASVVFPSGGNAYTARHFTGGLRKIATDDQIISKSYQFDDRNHLLQGLNAAEPFQDKWFEEHKIYLDALGAAVNYREIHAGYMEEPEFDESWMNLKVIDGKSLGQKAINEYYQKPCNNKFGDTRCNRDGRANLAALTYTGTADGGSADYLIDNNLSQANDYWNFGPVNITIGGYNYERLVADFDAATHKIIFDTSLPVPVSIGDSYKVTKGCPKTWEACQHKYSYGPSTDNRANFIGFIHLAGGGSSNGGLSGHFIFGDRGSRL